MLCVVPAKSNVAPLLKSFETMAVVMVSREYEVNAMNRNFSYGGFAFLTSQLESDTLD